MTSLRLLIKLGMMVLFLNIDNMELQTRFVVLRSSCTEAFHKNSVLKNVTKFTGKHLSQSLLFCEVLKNTFFYRPPPVAASEFLNGLFLKKTKSSLEWTTFDLD